MEKSPKVSSIEFNLHKKPIKLPFECLDDSSTQDATDFEKYIENDNKQSVSDCSQTQIDGDKQTKNEELNFLPTLTLNLTNYFGMIDETNILSPVSELAMNVALTTITSADNVTGEYNNFLPDCLLLH